MADQKKTRNIVIAIDGSEQADRAFNWYFDIVHHQGNNVICVYVAQPSSMYMDEYLETPSVSVLNEHWEKCMKESDKLINKYEAKLKEKNATGRVTLLEGQPGDAIVRGADDNHADMVVMGTRGLGTIRRTIMGSVSDYVVHHASCPVVVYRVQEAAQ